MSKTEADASPEVPATARRSRLARIAAHLRVQNWTAIALEFLVVVAGVFIGLQATNWNDDLTDRRREAVVLAEIAADLRQDREELASGRAIALRRIAAGNQMLELATGRRMTSINMFAVDNRSLSTTEGVALPETPPLSEQARAALWSTFVTGYYPTPSTTAFDSCLAPGSSGSFVTPT